MFIYYVYAYLRRSDGTPYYIGKGKGKRVYSSKHNVTVPSDKRYIVFLEQNLSETGALALERRYIRWYGLKINHTGILYNLTEGGDGGDTSLSPRFQESLKKRPSKKGMSYEEIYGVEKAKQLRESRSRSNLKRLGHSDLTRERISTTRKIKIAAGLIAKSIPPQTEESRRKGIEARKHNAIKISCPHCHKSGDSGAMKRWHFGRCREVKLA
jgi:hypothetical protein